MPTPPIRPSGSTPPGPPDPEDTPTAVDHQTPMDLVLHELGTLARKVDALTDLVSRAIDSRLSDEQAFANSRTALRRIDGIDERLDGMDQRCASHHPHHHRPNGNGHG